MGTVSLDDILVTPLKQITTLGGDILHALKSSDYGYNGFGEVYFSWVNKGAIKAWKLHDKMTLNLVVPYGEVSFVFHLINGTNNFRKETVNKERYVRLTVPPKIWFGFQGKSLGSSLIVNVADIEHDPEEVSRKSVSDINYEWN